MSPFPAIRWTSDNRTRILLACDGVQLNYTATCGQEAAQSLGFYRATKTTMTMTLEFYGGGHGKGIKINKSCKRHSIGGDTVIGSGLTHYHPFRVERMEYLARDKECWSRRWWRGIGWCGKGFPNSPIYYRFLLTWYSSSHSSSSFTNIRSCL